MQKSAARLELTLKLVKEISVKQPHSNVDKIRRCAESLARKNPSLPRIVEASASSYRAAWLGGQIDFLFFCLIAMGERCPMQESPRKLEACRCELRHLKDDLRAVGFPLQSISSLRQKHVGALVRLWTDVGIESERLAWKCAALEMLLKVLGKYPTVRATSAAE
jgi:hypothetical protein